MVSETNKKRMIWLFLLIASALIGIKLLIVTDISMSDECHQIATSYRFCLGDSPLVDDWSAEQLHGLVLLPLVWTYICIMHSTTGIVLYIRICFYIIKLAIAIWALRKTINATREFYPVAAILLWYCFIPFNIESMTYQAVPLLFMFIATIIISYDTIDRLSCMVLGIAYALSILSQPFWLISFIPIAVWMVIYRKSYYKSIIYFFCGVLIIFGSFCILVFSRATFREVLINLPYIFSETDHNIASTGLVSKVVRVFVQIITNYKFITVINLGFVAILIFQTIVGSCYKDKMRVLVPVCLLVSIVSIIINHGAFLMNEMFIPFIWMGIENMFFEYRNKKYVYLFLLSLIFSIATAMGTNTGMSATSASLSWMAVIVLLFTHVDYRTKNEYKRIAVYVPIFSICILVLGLRFFITWWGDYIRPYYFRYFIGDGPMRYMYAGEGNFQIYYDMYDTIKDMRLTEEDIFFVGTSTPLAYLDAETEYGTMGTPFIKLDYDRLREYYDMHRDKRPTIAYFYNVSDEDIDTHFFSVYFSEQSIERIGNALIIKENNE